MRFFCDLDHTIIYSHRVSLGPDKVVAEYLNGKEQSFMTRETYRFFSCQSGIPLIPVTTRSKAQFERLHVFQGAIRCKYALICNGGVLLVDGAEDADWYRESLSLISQAIPELNRMRALVQRISPTSRIHDVCGLYFYAGHEEPAVLARQLKQSSEYPNIRILHDRHKVYCIPEILNKGTAVKRFAGKFGDTMTIAAGDSEFDIPMLARADIRMIPPGLAQDLPEENTIIVSDSVFSDGICSYLNTIVK